MAQPTGTTEASVRGGMLDAVLFAVALSGLNIAYRLGNQWGVKPLTMLVWAMPSAAVALLLIGGVGRDWWRVMRHPLSLMVGAGIIGMEAVYYVLLTYTTPTDGSILVRLGVPISMVLGMVLRGRIPSLLMVLGGAIIVAAVLWYVPRMATDAPLLSLVLGAACGFIMSARSFGAEFHPWNRAARTILQKMRVTGLMLMTTSLIGLAGLAVFSWAASHGLAVRPAWVPATGELLAPDGIFIGLLVGLVVLTSVQYLGFSTVVKLGTEVFVATTALIPIVTLAVQELFVGIGVLDPIVVEWQVLPAVVGIIAGVALVIVGHRRHI
ncbi:MAG: hypothetical protein ACK5JT_06225 [Hyphomicrobiaceae bacterium]